MKFIMLFMMIVSSGSVFAAAFFGRRYEETLPVTLFGHVLIIYAFGLVGFLKAGVYTANLLAAALWAAAVIKVVKDKSYRNFISNLITPASVFLALITAFSVYSIIGIKVYGWDEFSHWGSCVKRMYYHNGLCTDFSLGADFPSYPPAMAIFQYAAIVLRGEFADWPLYFCYSFFCVALLMPFFRKMSCKNVVKNTAVMLMTVFVVITVAPKVFVSIYIDTFLGFMFGFLIAYLFCFDCFGDMLGTVTFSAATAVIVLTKDAGMLYAVTMVLAYCTAYLYQNKGRIKELKGKDVTVFLMPVLALAVSKLSWKRKLWADSTPIIFDGAYNLKEFISILAGGNAGYRTQVFKYFNQRFFNCSYGDYGFFRSSYAVILGLLVLIIAALAVLHNQKDGKGKGRRNITVFTAFFTVIVYVAGMMASYMYKFIEYEAVRLASFDRYLSVIVIALSVSAVVITADFMSSADCKGILYPLAAVYIVLCLANNNYMKDMLGREYVKASHEAVSGYELILNKVQENVTDDSPILIISQGDMGYDRFFMLYHLYPLNVVRAIPYSITAGETPLFEGDIWTSTGYSLRDFYNSLVGNSYKYVVIIRSNRSFSQDYAELFENPDDIADNSLYKFDSESGKLALVI